MLLNALVRFGIALALVLLLGCAVAPLSPTVPLASGVAFNLRPPEDFIGPSTLEQRIELLHQEQRFVFSAVVECYSTALTVVGLAPMGTRVFAMRWDGTTLWQDRERIQNFPFDLRYLLVDLQLSLFPLESVRKGFGDSAVTITEVGGVRIFKQSGEPFARVSYEAGKPWTGHVVFENLRRGYRIDIQTIESFTAVTERARD